MRPNEHPEDVTVSDAISGALNIGVQNSTAGIVGLKISNELPSSGGLVSADALATFVIINNVVLAGAISAFGSVFNVINLIVFYRIGFKDTINISLFSLALADLGSILPFIWKAILYNPYFNTWDKLSFDYNSVQYLTSGRTHFCFARITSVITAFVTFERCLCIAMPLKVRRIITPTRTVIIVVFIYLPIIGSVAAAHAFTKLGPVFVPKRNKTLIGMIYVKNGLFVESIGISFNFAVQMFSVAVVIICTFILVVQLVRKSAWRAKTVGTKDSISNVRDLKVIKMVSLLSIIFIICLLPSAANLVMMVADPEYNIKGRYRNLMVFTWAFFNTLEATNSTVNIFVYLRMSSKYAAVFNDMFGSCLKLCRRGGKSEEESKEN